MSEICSFLSLRQFCNFFILCAIVVLHLYFTMEEWVKLGVDKAVSDLKVTNVIISCLWNWWPRIGLEMAFWRVMILSLAICFKRGDTTRFINIILLVIINGLMIPVVHLLLLFRILKLTIYAYFYDRHLLDNIYI